MHQVPWMLHGRDAHCGLQHPFKLGWYQEEQNNRILIVNDDSNGLNSTFKKDVLDISGL